MSRVGSIGSTLNVANTTSHERPDVASPADAARQFEALMIGFMLKSGREAGSSSWLGTGDDAAGGSAIGYAEEQLAQALSAKGGLGLARMITAGLEDQSRLNSKELASPSDATTGTTDPGSKP